MAFSAARSSASRRFCSSRLRDTPDFAVAVAAAEAAAAEAAALRAPATSMARRDSQLALFQEVLDSAQVGFNLAVAKLKGQCAESFHEFPVVRDDDQGAVELQQRLLEHVFGGHVQVVGGLVKNQEVDGIQHQLAKGKSAAFATRQHPNLLLHVVTAKHKVAEQVARVSAYLVRSRVFNGLQHRFGSVQHFGLVLSVVSHFNLVSPLDAALAFQAFSQNFN